MSPLIGPDSWTPWLEAGTTAGDILNRRRREGGFTAAQIAEVDGNWTELEVLQLEARSPAGGPAVKRYLDALRELERRSGGGA